MRDLTIRDSTQEAILTHLKSTEELLAKAASKASGRTQDAEIWALPDLGLPHNVRRMHGGFFTGALYTWSTSVPLVPIDATVNVCGISCYKLRRPFESEAEFTAAITNAKQKTTKSSYEWNFAVGNHFIICVECTEPGVLGAGQYLLLHSSAAEFKNHFNGLYPSPGNWYADDIETVEQPGGRYLRYISGAVAEQFYGLANMLSEFNKLRHRHFADLVAGRNGIDREVLSIQHYGMPSHESVAIGCQVLPLSQTFYFLLSRPGEPITIIRPDCSGSNQTYVDGRSVLLGPHGLGVRWLAPISLRYEPDGLVIGGKRFDVDASLRHEILADVRRLDGVDAEVLPRILKQCPGSVIGHLTQRFSHHRRAEQ